MARKSFSVLFFIKKGKLLKNGEAPVCMRITVNGCMADVSIKRSCLVNLWNPAKENSKGKDRMSVELNHYLEITRSHIHQIYRELETSGKVITVDLVRKLFYGVGEDNKTLLQVFRLCSSGLCYGRFEVVGNYGIGYTSKIMEGIFTCLDKIFFLLRWYSFVIRNLTARKYSGKDFHGNLITRIPVCNIKFVTGKIHIHLITRYMIYASNRYFYFLFTSEIQAE